MHLAVMKVDYWADRMVGQTEASTAERMVESWAVLTVVSLASSMVVKRADLMVVHWAAKKVCLSAGMMAVPMELQ